MSEAAAAQVQTTQSQEAPPPVDATEAHETTQDDAADIAAMLGVELDGETEAQNEAPATSRVSTESDEKTDPLDLLKNDELFSERALSNQPGIGKARHALLAARKAVREQYQANHRTHLELAEREARIKDTGADLKKRTQAFDAHEKRFLADIDIALNGKPNEVLEALGRIARRSGQELYDGFTVAMLEAKKKPQVDPETKAKLSKIDELEEKLKRYEEKETVRSDAENATVARDNWFRAVAGVYEQNPEEYPSIKHYVDDQKVEDVRADLDKLNEYLWNASGRPQKGIPLDVLLGELDRRYAKKLREEGAESSPVTQKKNGRLPGSGPSPARAATNGQTRELTEEERMRDLAEDKDALRGLGFLV